MSYSLSDASAKTHKFLEAPYARVPKELGCAFAASALVSPLVSIIDKAIVHEITGIQSLMSSMGGACKEMMTQPRKFFVKGLSFRLTFAVYFGTFAVANLGEAVLDYKRERDDRQRKQVKVGCASAANIGLLAWRDSIFAKEFAVPGTKLPRIPIRTITLFAMRDSVTMAATFSAAPKVSQYLVMERGWSKNKADVTSSLSIPVLAQFISAPLHIHALDYYARGPQTSMSQFGSQVYHEMGKVCAARALRVLPAFGIGSYSNNQFREMSIKQMGGELTFGERIQRRVTSFEHTLRRQATTTTTVHHHQPQTIVLTATSPKHE